MRKQPLVLLFLLCGLAPLAQAARDGVILKDAIPIRTTAFDEKSKVIETFNTGDTVAITDLKENPAKTTWASVSWYEVTTDKGIGWVDGRDVFVFEDDRLFNRYIMGTEPVRELVQPGDTEQDEKLKILDSVDFYLRETRNKNEAARKHAAAGRLFYALTADKDIIQAWQRFQKDTPEIRIIADRAMYSLNSSRELFASKETQETLSKRIPEATEQEELDLLINLLNISNHPDKEQLLIQATKQGSRGAANALSVIPTKSAQNALLHLLDDPHEQIRNNAAIALIYRVAGSRPPFSPATVQDNNRMIQAAYAKANAKTRTLQMGFACHAESAGPFLFRAAAEDADAAPWNAFLRCMENVLAVYDKPVFMNWLGDEVKTMKSAERRQQVEPYLKRFQGSR